MKKVRLWTKDMGEKYTVMSDWKSAGDCKRQIIGRWGHWPPFAFISQAKTLANFIRYNGD
jgi:hypothetical protein